MYLLLLSKLRFLPLLKDRLLWLGLFLMIILAILTIPYVGLVNHRYFLPIQMDSTYAHQPFYSMEKEMYQKILDLGVDPTEVGTGFPIRSDQKYISLDTTIRSYKPFELTSDKYILYSNVINEFNGVTTVNTFKEATVMHSINKRGVKMVLYKMK